MKKPLRIATVAFVVFALVGCSNYDFNALGFASKADMDDAHSKGYHTKKKLDEMVIKPVEKVVAALAAPISSVAAKPETNGESNGVREGVTSKNDNNKPLENWNIKTSDYNLILQHMKESASYADVLPPNCSDNSDKGLQLICAREDFKNIAWVIKRLKIMAEENATKRQLDHKTAYSGVYKVDCNDQDCVGKFLQQSFYGAINEAGKTYLLAQPVKTVIVDTSPFSPSFDCAKASTGPERLICSDRDLAKLDVQLGQSYSKAVGSAADKKKMQLDQLDWLKRERNACSDKPCMAGAIEQRIKALSN